MLQNIAHAAGVKIHEFLLVFRIRRRNSKYRIDIVIIRICGNVLHLLHRRSHSQIKGAFILISQVQLAIEPVIRQLHTFTGCGIGKADGLRRACRSKSLKALQQISVCFSEALHGFGRYVAYKNILNLQSLVHLFLCGSSRFGLGLGLVIFVAFCVSIDIINICISVSVFFILLRCIKILVSIYGRQQIKSVIGRNKASINFNQHITLFI